MIIKKLVLLMALLFHFQDAFADCKGIAELNNLKFADDLSRAEQVPANPQGSVITSLDDVWKTNSTSKMWETKYGIRRSPTAALRHEMAIQLNIFNTAKSSANTSCLEREQFAAALEELYKQETAWSEEYHRAEQIDIAKNALTVTGNLVLLVTGVGEAIVSGKALYGAYKYRKAAGEIAADVGAFSPAGIYDSTVKAIREFRKATNVPLGKCLPSYEATVKAIKEGGNIVFERLEMVSREMWRLEKDKIWAKNACSEQAAQIGGLTDAAALEMTEAQRASLGAWSASVGRGMSQFFLGGQLIYELYDIENPYKLIIEGTFRSLKAKEKETIEFSEDATAAFNEVNVLDKKIKDAEAADLAARGYKPPSHFEVEIRKEDE